MARLIDVIKEYAEHPLTRFAVWTLLFLLMGNLFFLKRLVDTVDKSQERVWELSQKIVVLEATVTTLKENMKIRRGE